jgi:hypothetical protein
MLRELDGHGNGVQNPTQNELASFPKSVALGELLFRGWFFAVGVVVRFKGAEDIVQAVKEHSTN